MVIKMEMESKNLRTVTLMKGSTVRTSSTEKENTHGTMAHVTSVISFRAYDKVKASGFLTRKIVIQFKMLSSMDQAPN